MCEGVLKEIEYMKILHCSDLHLGRRPVGSPDSLYSKERYNDFFRIFEYVINQALEKEINIFVISGDFFDKKDINPKNLEDAQKLLKKLVDKNIKILLIEGNHDRTFFEEKSWVSYFDSFENIYYLDSVKRSDDSYEFTPTEIDGINFYGINYYGSNTDEILTLLAEKLNTENNFIITHTSIGNGTDFIPGLVSSGVLDLFKNKVLYIAGGHIHSKKTYPVANPFFFVPGSLEYWDLAEIGEKGYFVFDSESKEVEYFSVLDKIRRKVQLNYDIKEKFLRDFESNLFAKLENEEIPKRCIYILNLYVELHDFTVDTKKIEDFLTEKGVLKAAVYVKRRGEVYRIDDYSDLSEDEIIGSIIENSEEWFKYRKRKNETLNSIKRLKNYQQSNNQKQFIEELDSLFEKILGDDKNDNQ